MAESIGFLAILRTDMSRFHRATGVPYFQLLFILVGRGVFDGFIVIDPEAEYFSVLWVNADAILSDVAAIYPHTITLLICKIFI